MATKKYVSPAKLAYFSQKSDEKNAGKFVAKETGKGLSTNDLTNELKTGYDGAVTHAAKPHIWGVQKNGSDVAADGEGKVNLTFGPLADKAQVSESDLDSALAEKVNAASEGNHSHLNKDVLDGITAQKVQQWDAAQPNVIEIVKVNGSPIDISEKAANVSVPTTVAQLTDAASYAKVADIYTRGDLYNRTEIDAKLSSVYKYMGSVESYAALPTEGVEKGHVYNVAAADSAHGIKAGDNVAWDGTAWDVLSGIVDLTGYVQDADLVEVTEEEIDDMFA